MHPLGPYLVYLWADNCIHKFVHVIREQRVNLVTSSTNAQRPIELIECKSVNSLFEKSVH